MNVDFQRVAMACDGESFAVVLGRGLDNVTIHASCKVPCAGMLLFVGFESCVMLDPDEYQRGLTEAARGDMALAKWALRVHDQHRVLDEAVADAWALIGYETRTRPRR